MAIDFTLTPEQKALQKTAREFAQDPNAPIMQEAGYCIVGDLYEVIPTLTRALRQMLKKPGE